MARTEIITTVFAASVVLANTEGGHLTERRDALAVKQPAFDAQGVLIAALLRSGKNSESGHKELNKHLRIDQ